MDKNKTLQSKAAIRLWCKGKDVWNKWVEENPKANVNFSEVDFSKERTEEKPVIDFRGFNFPKGNVSFWGAKFGEGDVNFRGVNFGEGYVNFGEVNFGKGTVSFMLANFGDGIVHFWGAKFGEGTVSFWGAKFGKGYVRFQRANFSEGDVDFGKVNFGKGIVDFGGANFGEGDVSFSEIRLKGKIVFARTNFNKTKSFSLRDISFPSSVLFDGMNNACIPDLRNSSFEKHVSLAGVNIKLPRHKYFPLMALHEDDYIKAQRLKELAGNNQDRRTELDMLALELKAKRFRHLGVGPLIFSYIHEITSNFGRSILLPLCWLIVTILASSCYYYHASNKADGDIANSIFFSASHALPFISASRNVKTDKAKTLFKTNNDGDVEIPPNVNEFAMFEGVFCFIFLFSIGLSIRNQFMK